jgi:hypothetical protein
VAEVTAVLPVLSSQFNEVRQKLPQYERTSPVIVLAVVFLMCRMSTKLSMIRRLGLRGQRRGVWGKHSMRKEHC